MSAYGKIVRPTDSKVPATLSPRVYRLPSGSMTVFHFSSASTSALDESLLVYLSKVFDAVVEEGRTYPQLEVGGVKGFKDYFFGQDCFVGLLNASGTLDQGSIDGKDVEEAVDFETARAGRSWEECILGMFYVKPNYPGRSSHLCNGGFVVPPHHRGLRMGVTLGRAFLHYAPKLGYRGSVFNLVYVSNVASTRIWDQLGFEKAGLIPGAGRLKSKVEGAEEEYVDAIVYFKSFV